jgi:hypothetical protein
MKRAALALLLVCAAAGAAHAQGSKKKEMAWTPGQGIDWQGDWEAAVKEATARNVPIHIAVHKDN